MNDTSTLTPPKPGQNAEQRGMDLMLVKGKDLPEAAKAYLKDLARRVGMCMEVCLTAWCTYAHLTEGLPLGEDDLYHPPESEIARYRACTVGLPVPLWCPTEKGTPNG